MPGLIAGADPDWETALLLPVPTAGPAVSRHRARLDEAARDGVPAHITVLYPFLPPAGIGEPLLASPRKLFAGIAAFEFTLDQVGWFGEEVVWLGPRDPAPFTALTALVCAAFPSCPPYGGQSPEVIPHLTIGQAGRPQALRAAVESVHPCLPIKATAAQVSLMTGPALALRAPRRASGAPLPPSRSANACPRQRRRGEGCGSPRTCRRSRPGGA
jgi:hypothetical protein